MPRSVALTVKQMIQLDFLVSYARRELNYTSGQPGGKHHHLKLTGPGKRYSYDVDCARCDEHRYDLPGAKLVIAFVMNHLGHSTSVALPRERERTPAELNDAARFERHNVKRRKPVAAGGRQVRDPDTGKWFSI